MFFLVLFVASLMGKQMPDDCLEAVVEDSCRVVDAFWNALGVLSTPKQTPRTAGCAASSPFVMTATTNMT